MKKHLTAIAVVLLLSNAAWAVDDTPENRAQQADRYLAARPTKTMLAKILQQVVTSVPPEHRAGFKALLDQHLDAAKLEKAMKDSLVKKLSADELKAMADYYSSPVAQSAMNKFDGCISEDFLPAVREEIMAAQAKAGGEAKPDDSKAEATKKKPEDAKPAEPKK